MNIPLPQRLVKWPNPFSQEVPLDEMYAKLICHPPLGQATVVPAEQESVQIVVCLEAAPSAERIWEVALWHNHSGSNEWETLSLRKTDASSETFLNAQSDNKTHRHWFRTNLPGRPASGGHVSFAIRFRSGDKDTWKWARDHFSVGDAHLYYQPESLSDRDLSYFIDGISSDFTVSKERSDTDDTLLWDVSAPVNAASGQDSGWSSHTLGIPTNFTRWFSLVRLWAPWIAPRHGQGNFKLDKDGILAAFLRHDGSHIVCLAISGIDDVLTFFQNDDKGNIIVKSRNDRDKTGEARIIVAVAKSFAVANAAVMYRARKLVMAYEAAAGELNEELKALTQDPPSPQWLEEWYDGFSYCTWNGLGQQLTEKKIYNALKSLEDNDIHITNLIIDDNWQTLDQEGANQPQKAWKEFEANKEGFPKGLGYTAQKIRAEHKSIKHIAVWHALIGYWGGISPEGNLAQEYKTCKVRKSPGVTGSEWLLIDKEDLNRFYDDFYQFLSSSGIDSVKTDAQFSIDELTDAPDRRRLIHAYQDAWTIASLRHFSARAISCMSQAPQIMFHSQMPTNKPRLLVRNSDDFFPDIDDSHPWHIFCNAHNSLFTQHLNALPDWDMFQTSHKWASFHAAARCVSGGPIYFTDTPGKHDVDLIYQMTAKTPRGATVILRPHIVGRTTQAYVSYEEQSLLKVETYVGAQRTGTGILGIFNVSQRDLAEIVLLNEFPGTEEGTYIVRAHTTGAISVPMSRKDDWSFIALDVASRGWEILSAFPLRSFDLKRKNGTETVTVANLGLLGKMTGAAAIVNTDFYVENEGAGRLRCWTSLKALGIYGLYISDLDKRSLEDDLMALMFGKPVSLETVKKSKIPNVLEVDLDKAWKESDQKAGWSNEVAIEVFIR